jgi:anti-anti-sigma factor
MGYSGDSGGTGAAPGQERLQFTRYNGRDGEVLLQIAGEVDMATAPAFLASLRAAIQDGDGAVVLDLAQVTFIDSAGIEQLVRAREESQGRIRLRALHPSVQRVLEMTALLEWFPFCSDGAGPAPDRS